jgi:hypothetical protein
MRDVKLREQSCIVDYDGGGDLGVECCVCATSPGIAEADSRAPRDVGVAVHGGDEVLEADLFGASESSSGCHQPPVESPCEEAIAQSYSRRPMLPVVYAQRSPASAHVSTLGDL